MKDQDEGGWSYRGQCVEVGEGLGGVDRPDIASRRPAGH